MQVEESYLLNEENVYFYASPNEELAVDLYSIEGACLHCLRNGKLIAEVVGRESVHIEEMPADAATSSAGITSATSAAVASITAASVTAGSGTLDDGSGEPASKRHRAQTNGGAAPGGESVEDGMNGGGELMAVDAAKAAESVVTNTGAVVEAISCTECGSGDSGAGNDILLCDGLGCDKCFHQHCVSPPVLKVPENEWLCTACVAVGNKVDPAALAEAARQQAAAQEWMTQYKATKGFDGFGGDMLMCTGCLDRFHLQCLESSLDNRRDRWATWRCIRCKTCETCGADGSKIRLAICETCDRGYHIGCLDPPLKAFPLRAFKCPHCVKCSSCGSTDAKAWTKDYEMCAPCGTQFKQKKFCPICMHSHRADEVDMVQCDKCMFWVHARCDNLDSAGFEALKEVDEYSCPNCRGERTATLLRQVLTELDKEDRDKFFAEPVPIEFALMTQYHTIVSHPMDYKTMRGKINANEYGTEVHSAVAAFKADFDLVCNNAMAFHRPNERCHITARRMLRLGTKLISTTFPWHKVEEVDKGEGGAGKGGAGGKADPGKSVVEDVEEQPELESEWDHSAAVSFELGDAGAATVDACFVCGALAHYESGRVAEAELLHCNVCAESFHSFCVPYPTSNFNEETRLQWTCPRCRPPPKGVVSAAAGADGTDVEPVELRCARCDRRRPPSTQQADAEVGDLWVCSDCRHCEGCGTMTARSWSADGVWCAACSPAGYEGRYCGICARQYDDKAAEAQAMVNCDRCGLWVHPACDQMSDADYISYTQGEPGFERYECPDCRRDAQEHPASMWRASRRLTPEHALTPGHASLNGCPPARLTTLTARHRPPSTITIWSFSSRTLACPHTCHSRAAHQPSSSQACAPVSRPAAWQRK